MKFLFVLHDPPYGSERVYNGTRWAREVLKSPEADVRVFLFGDAVVAANGGQQVPKGYYNAGTMLASLSDRGAAVGACGTCMEARGLAAERLLDGAHRSSMAELAEWTAWADQVINI